MKTCNIARQCPICEKRKDSKAFHVKPGGELSRGCKTCVMSPAEQAREIDRLYVAARSVDW